MGRFARPNLERDSAGSSAGATQNDSTLPSSRLEQISQVSFQPSGKTQRGTSQQSIPNVGAVAASSRPLQDSHPAPSYILSSKRLENELKFPYRTVSKFKHCWEKTSADYNFAGALVTDLGSSSTELSPSYEPLEKPNSLPRFDGMRQTGVANYGCRSVEALQRLERIQNNLYELYKTNGFMRREDIEAPFIESSSRARNLERSIRLGLEIYRVVEEGFLTHDGIISTIEFEIDRELQQYAMKLRHINDYLNYVTNNKDCTISDFTWKQITKFLNTVVSGKDISFIAVQSFPGDEGLDHPLRALWTLYESFRAGCDYRSLKSLWSFLITDCRSTRNKLGRVPLMIDLTDHLEDLEGSVDVLREAVQRIRDWEKIDDHFARFRARFNEVQTRIETPQITRLRNRRNQAQIKEKQQAARRAAGLLKYELDRAFNHEQHWFHITDTIWTGIQLRPSAVRRIKSLKLLFSVASDAPLANDFCCIDELHFYNFELEASYYPGSNIWTSSYSKAQIEGEEEEVE